uniref:Uncharacterized protein n=1 Tax=Ascaris lumbricoides TaxID=6252 RepID=A0A9J2PE67_ASCLU
MGEAYEALGPVDSEPPPQPPATAPAPSPPPPPPPPPSAQTAGTATGVGAATEGRTKPAFGMAHENTDFGIVSAYTLNSAAAQPVISEHSAPLCSPLQENVILTHFTLYIIKVWGFSRSFTGYTM